MIPIEHGIAIIGMSGRFPGAETIEEYWENLCGGKEAISRFTNEELKQSGVSEKLAESPQYIRAKAILKDIELFDAEFFGMSAKEAQITDPQHRLFLECAWEALESAGYHSEGFSGSIGVYGGSGPNTYYLNHLHPNTSIRETTPEELLRIGNEKDYLTTRVSYKLNLKGPSLNIQTACSTSLAAICTACNHLLTYQCDMALAGGVSISTPQQTGYSYKEGMIFSPDGSCRPFDANANGTVPGNCVGLVVLKRYEEALADGDRIYAVIRGYGLNNDGKEKIGFSAPSVQGQSQAIASAIDMAGISAETISYVEAHGTGTVLGDPIEIAALTEAFQRDTDKKGICAIGSAKGNIGHTMEAAGVAGLIKAVLSLDRRTLPPSLHFKQANPHIDFEKGPFYVNTTLKPWEEKSFPRRASVSSFGFGGTNAHVVLEESPARVPTSPPTKPQSLTLSAKTPAALEKMSSRLAEHLRKNPTLNLADVAFTLQKGRKTFECKRTVVCDTLQEAIEALSSPDQNQTINNELQQEQQIQPGRRVPLPTYPFEKKRYWIDPEVLKSVPNVKVKENISVETSLLAIWKELLGISAISINDDFFKLGGDSLIAIQMIAQIETDLGVSLKLPVLLERSTIAQLAPLIAQKKPQPPTHIVELKQGDKNKPLFLIHPIGGTVYCYKPLVDCLAYPGTIYGIESPETSSFKTIEEIAFFYIQTIRRIQPEGPYSLLGASFGGLISFEIARQLSQAGQTISLLAMADILRPEQIVERNSDPVSLLIELFEGKEFDRMNISSEDQMKRLIQSMGLEFAPFSEQRKIFERVKIHCEALSRYHPQQYKGKILFFQADEKFIRNPNLSLGDTWKDLAEGGIEIHDISGNHLSMLTQPHVAKLAHLLETHLPK